MKLPFVWISTRGSGQAGDSRSAATAGARHPFPDVLARSRRREGSNHGGCPASSRSLLPARQLKQSATHPCRHAHELGAASLHVAPHRKPTAIATAGPTRTTPYQQDTLVPQLRIRCADSVTFASGCPSVPCPPPAPSSPTPPLAWSTTGSGDGGRHGDVQGAARERAQASGAGRGSHC
jgi:hypothetical protein